MGKENKKKQVEFNLADYNYMDNDLPLIGWVWEFARRSKEHLEYWSEHVAIERKMEKREDYGKVLDYREEHGFFPYFQLNGKSPYEKWSNDLSYKYSMDKLGVSKSYPLYVANLKWESDPWYDSNLKRKLYPAHEKLTALKNPKEFHQSIIREIFTPAPGSITCKAINLKDIDLETDPSNKGQTIECEDTINRTPIDRLVKHYGDENVVMALIDLSAPISIDEILKQLKQELVKWRKILDLQKTKSAKTSKTKKNQLLKKSKIWKSYLIIYDLFQENESYPIISDLLLEYDSFYAIEKNVENHHKAAVKMINGGYKKLL